MRDKLESPLPSLYERDVNLVCFVVSGERVQYYVYTQSHCKLPLALSSRQERVISLCRRVFGPCDYQGVPAVEEQGPVHVFDSNALESGLNALPPARRVEEVKGLINRVSPQQWSEGVLGQDLFELLPYARVERRVGSPRGVVDEQSAAKLQVPSQSRALLLA